MPDLPTGTVTFLFTDIDGSTRLVQDLGDAVSKRIFADHRRLLVEAVQSAGGTVYQDQGESFVFVFSRAKDAVRAAVAAQRALGAHSWPDDRQPRVRMGLHTGEPVGESGEYVGLDVHRSARICGVGHGGQILLSLTTRELIADDVPDGITFRDLGDHQLKDLARPQRLFQIVAADLPADFPPLNSLDLLPNNLPRQLTSFIGREEQIAEVKRLLSTSPLLTLTGVGGVGKTRLSVQAAAGVVDQFQHGVWLVELAPLSDPSLVPQSVSTVLGVREQPGRSILDVITDFLQPKELLLVLDNVEHLIAACAQLADALLRACPNLRIMVTSRESLGIAGETVWPVPALSFPDTQLLQPVEQFLKSEAIRLFVERATTIVPTFKLTDRNGLAVARICQRLDGLPLAIELAAARVKVLSVEEIAERLNDRFRLLTGGGRTTLPRHQTLQAAIDWSYDLLSEKERTLLGRLSVFAGGWTLEAGETVCTGGDVELREVLDLLTHLVDKSLVIAEERNGEARYRYLETIRQYAGEKLLDAGEQREVQRKHRDWYLTLAGEASKTLRAADAARWLDRLEADHDNLRAALEWSLTREGDAEIALRLAAALAEFWIDRYHYSEGRLFLAAALAGGQAKAPRPMVAKALADAGLLASRQHDASSAKSHYDRARSLYQELGDEEGIARCLYGLGRESLRQGDTAVARSFLERCVEIWRRLGQQPAIARALKELGYVELRQGDAELARALFEESLTIARELGMKDEIAWSLIDVGSLARERGNYQQAAALYSESLSLFKEQGDKPGIAWVRENLGYVSRHDGDYEQAARHFMESLLSFRELGQPWGIAASMAGLAGVAESTGRAEHAARLLGASEKLLNSIGFVREERIEYARALAAIRGELSEQAFAAAWAEGTAMTVDEAIEYALGTPL